MDIGLKTASLNFKKNVVSVLCHPLHKGRNEYCMFSVMNLSLFLLGSVNCQLACKSIILSRAVCLSSSCSFDLYLLVVSPPFSFSLFFVRFFSFPFRPEVTLCS